MKNKKLAVILPIFIVGVIGITFAIYWFFLRKKPEEPTPDATLPTETPTQTALQAPTVSTEVVPDKTDPKVTEVEMAALSKAVTAAKVIPVEKMKRLKLLILKQNT